MKKVISILTAVLFVFAIATAAVAAEEKKAPAAGKKAEVKEAKKAETKKAAKVHKQITGEVKAVDAAGKTITVVKKVKDKAEEVVIAVDDKQLASVKAGDKVTVKYAVADNKNTAKTITLKADKKAPAKAKSEKPAEPAKAAKPAAPVKK